MFRNSGVGRLASRTMHGDLVHGGRLDNDPRPLDLTPFASLS
jgi:hypothetical protein